MTWYLGVVGLGHDNFTNLVIILAKPICAYDHGLTKRSDGSQTMDTADTSIVGDMK